MSTPTSDQAVMAPDIPKLLQKKPRSPFRRAFDHIRSEYGYLMFAALIPAVLVYLLYLVRGLYPFGDGCVLVLDLNGQYVSFYEGLYNILHGDADLFYSFSRNLGGEFMGIYDYYVASPFALLLGLFPQDWMLEGLLVVFIIKAALCGLNMGIYLHKHSDGDCNRLSVIAFSIMYALCSYCVIQQHNSMWIDAVLWLPLLTLGIEELIKRGKFRLYVFTLAITLWSNFYIGYMVVIYTFIYCFYYYFAHNRNGENNPLGERAHFIKSVGRVLLFSVLAVGMAALVILTARYSLSFGKNEFDPPEWDIVQKFELFPFFQKFLPSSYDTVRRMGLPTVYCGVLTIMLVPAYFMSKKFSMREKVASAIFILLFVVSFATSTLDLIWHGFQEPNWLNYRYSFMLCFFLIVLAYRAFDKIRFTSRKALLGAVAFIALYVVLLPVLSDYLILMNGKEEVTTSYIRPFATIWLSLGCLFVYFILIALYGKVKARGKETVSMILVFVVCVEIFLSGMCDMEELNTDVSYSKYSKYNNMIDTLRPISDTVQSHDKGFYRMEKTYERKTNDNFALLMKGVSLSTSTFNRKTIDFLNDMGYDAKSHNSKYYGGTPVNDSLLGIKYLITDKDMTAYYGEPIFTKEDYGYDEDYKPNGSYDVYQNAYALSLIYGVSERWLDFDADAYTSPMDSLNAMVTAMLGEDETVRLFVPLTPEGDPELVNVKISDTRDNHLHYEVMNTNDTGSTLTYTYTVPADTELYFHLPTSYYRQIALKMNGSKVSGTYADHIFPLGTSSTTEMKLEVKIDNTSNNLWIDKDAAGLVYYVDMEVLAEAMDKLATGNVTIDEGYTDSHLYGSVTTAEAKQLMFTSIPYDEGWHVYVDGEAVETFMTGDALISFYIDGAGEHELELRYMPKAISLGLSITIVSLIVFIILLIIYPKAKKIPVLGGILYIQGEESSPIVTEELLAEIEPGDIGSDDDGEPEEAAPAEEDADSPAADKPTRAERAERSLQMVKKYKKPVAGKGAPGGNRHHKKSKK